MQDNSVLIVFAGQAPVKNGDAHYHFSPDRNFFYLTGIDREKHILLMIKRGDKVDTTLFLERYDEFKAKWNGAVLREEEAKEISGIEKLRFLDEFEDFVPSPILRGGITKVYLDFSRFFWGADTTPADKFAAELKAKRPTVELVSAESIFGELRSVKSAAEIANIQKAVDITGEGLEEMMKNAKPGMYEYELEAHFDYIVKKHGTGFGFTTIAAGGGNATTLHYHDNNQQIADGSLVLFDLGAEWNYYSADITRTFPVNGKYTERQKQLYNIVLEAGNRVIAAAKPGLPVSRLNEIVIEYYGEELVKIGLIKDKSEVSRYYYHGVSHGLGLETHDAGRPKELAPGMVYTVEPGLYVAEENIGIRIEDDIVITENGCEVLSKNIIKTVEDIEKFMAK